MHNVNIHTVVCMYNIQDISKFKFPLVLDMAPFCEAGSVTDITMYELFSVVIHSGSTHSGHYVAYIRDVDDLGKWTYPVCVPVLYMLGLSDGKTVKIISLEMIIYDHMHVMCPSPVDTCMSCVPALWTHACHVSQPCGHMHVMCPSPVDTCL